MNPEINDQSEPIWYFVKQGSRFGPYNFHEIKQLSASGGLLPDDLIWRPGFAQWAPAREIAGLFTPYQYQAPPASFNYPAGATPVQSTATGPGAGTRIIWLFLLLFICLGMLASAFFFFKHTVIVLGLLIVIATPAGLLAWGIFHGVIGRKYGAGQAVLSLFAIYISLFAGGLVGYLEQRKAAIQAINEIQREFSNFNDSMTDSNGVPRPIGHRANTEPTAKGEFGEVERFVKTFLNRVASQRNDYMLELDTIGWNKMLDPERLNKDRALTETRFMTRKAREIMGKYRDKTYAIIDNVPNDIAALDLSDNMKRQMLSGFNKGMERSKRQIDEIWGLESRIMTEFENITTLLSAKKRGWIISNRQILFYSQYDVNSFNSYLASIQDLTRRQEAIRKQSVDSSNDLFNRLKQ